MGQIIEIKVKDDSAPKGNTGCLGAVVFFGQFVGYASIAISNMAYMGFFV